METLFEIKKQLKKYLENGDEKGFKVELPRLMRRSAKLRRTYYHYTDVDSFCKMFNCDKGYLRFTRLTSMKINDLHESRFKGCEKERGRIFIACFTFTSTENMAMWAMYGGKENTKKIRIAFPYNLLNELTGAEIFFEDDGGSYTKVDDSIRRKCEVYFTEVCYVKGLQDNLKGIYYGDKFYSTRCFSGSNYDCTAEITGSIKNEVWRYENEVRMIIKMPNNNFSDGEYLYIQLPHGFAKRIKVMTGPQFDYDNSMGEILQGVDVEKSAFEGLVNL